MDNGIDEPLAELSSYLGDEIGGQIAHAQIAKGELTITVGRDELIEVLRFLRDDGQTQFVCIIDICGVDYPERAERFELVYHLLSPKQNLRVRIKVSTDAETPVPSVTAIYPGADWFEREAYDMYGVLFTGHPDLRRLLTDYGFDGHPLRKDFPVTGYVEVRYDDEAKRVVYEPVNLRQEYRDFDFLSPWEGVEYGLPEGAKDQK